MSKIYVINFRAVRFMFRKLPNTGCIKKKRRTMNVLSMSYNDYSQ